MPSTTGSDEWEQIEREPECAEQLTERPAKPAAPAEPPALDDVPDVVDGDRGLRDVGGQHDLALPGARPLEHLARGERTIGA